MSPRLQGVAMVTAASHHLPPLTLHEGLRTDLTVHHSDSEDPEKTDPSHEDPSGPHRVHNFS